MEADVLVYVQAIITGGVVGVVAWALLLAIGRR